MGYYRVSLSIGQHSSFSSERKSVHSVVAASSKYCVHFSQDDKANIFVVTSVAPKVNQI